MDPPWLSNDTVLGHHPGPSSEALAEFRQKFILGKELELAVRVYAQQRKGQLLGMLSLRTLLLTGHIHPSQPIRVPHDDESFDETHQPRGCFPGRPGCGRSAICWNTGTRRKRRRTTCCSARSSGSRSTTGRTRGGSRSGCCGAHARLNPNHKSCFPLVLWDSGGS